METDFSTKDLYLAGFIYAKQQVKFIGIKREGRICWFCFERKPLCEKLQQQFFDKSGMVIAKDFADAIRTLKDLVFTN